MLSLFDLLNMLPQMSDGLGSMLPSITRLGKADSGVSNSRFNDWFGGGAGRANGFGGPLAPADNSGLLADGDGGGRTTPLGGAFIGAALAGSLAEVSGSPPSEASLGICTFRRGLLASDCIVLDRDGGARLGNDEAELVR